MCAWVGWFEWLWVRCEQNANKAARNHKSTRDTLKYICRLMARSGANRCAQNSQIKHVGAVDRNNICTCVSMDTHGVGRGPSAAWS